MDVYHQPMTALANGRRSWKAITAGLSPEELADFEKAMENLELYERVWDLFEYSTGLSDNIQNLELRITSNNPIVPMNIYRKSEAASPDWLMGELEIYLEAYYDLIDQCKEFPDW
jgi:hypothetical protein